MRSQKWQDGLSITICHLYRDISLPQPSTEAIYVIETRKHTQMAIIHENSAIKMTRNFFRELEPDEARDSGRELNTKTWTFSVGCEFAAAAADWAPCETIAHSLHMVYRHDHLFNRGRQESESESSQDHC